MTEISLHQWFAEQISQISGSRIIGTPLEVLEKITHAERNYSWLSIIPDNIYPLVVKNDEPPFPNLESRNRQRKRLSGQFYTPRTLINQLLARIGPISPLMKILDPACGDGAFLIESSHALKNVDCINPLDHLWGYDLDAEALLISLGRLLFHYFGRGWPHLELRDFLIDPPNLKFDLILGNPPFKVNLPTKLRKKLSEMYETAEGEKDLCTFFLEGSVNALKPNGRLAMLISNTFLVNHQCKKIRNFLFSKNAARAIFLLPPRFFQSAPGVLGIILFLLKRPHDKKKLVIYDEYSPEFGWKNLKKVESLLFAEPTGLAKARLDKKTLSLFKNMEKVSQPLGKIANIGVGIQESLVRGERISRFVVGNAENSNHVPVLRGREISKFFIKWEGKYINYGPHLAYRGSPEVFQGEKILYQNIRNETLPTRLVAALDKKSFFPKNSLSIIWNPKPPFSLLYLLGLLNCRLVNSWFKCHYQSFHVTVTQVRTIPIPTGTPETRRILESLVEEILSQDPKELIFGELLDSLERAVVSCYFPGGRVRNSDLIKSS